VSIHRRLAATTNKTEVTNMNGTKQGLRVCALGAVLLSAVGTAAAQSNDTAYGTGALSNDSGYNNSAFGFNALFSNTTGCCNTATGAFALIENTTGDSNTASGLAALANNTTGSENTANGSDALLANTSSSGNTATGSYALESNNGANDTADGAEALQQNTTGSGNVASGVQALFSNTVGLHNTAVGTIALYHHTTGHSNTALGYQSGYNVTTGSNNIEVGSTGTSADANTIRLGTQGTQKATYIAGISGTPMTGADVVVSSTGRLGVLPSSARFKRDIQPLNNRSQGLWQLHPVTFRYRQDPGQRQYGLIAEQVAKVYPELVVCGDKGEIESVQYRELIPLMLNEMQHQQAALAELKTQNAALKERLERLEQAKTIASR
jgi:hypothetical protein